MKKLVSLLLVLALAISLVACTTGDTSLYDAFKNTQQVNAIETSTDISLDLSGEGLGESEERQLNQISSLVNGMGLNIKNKAVGNEEGTIASAESEINMNFMGMNIPLKSWSKVNLEEDEMLTISKIPEMAMGMMGSPIPGVEEEIENPLDGKKYIVNDMNEMMKAEGEEIDFEEMVELQKEFQPKLIELIEDVEEDLKLDSEIIKLEEEKEVDGEKIKTYRLHLNDKSFKEATKKTVNYLLESESAREFVVEFMNSYMDTLESMGMPNELNEDEIKQLEENMDELEDGLDENLGNMQEEFNKFMEKYKDLQILGEDGINILYYVNEDGYIVEKDGIIDLEVDLEQLAKYQGTEAEGQDQEVENEEVENEEIDEFYQAPEMKGKINLKIKFETENTNINNDELEVTLPELTPENSLTMEELTEIQMRELEKQREMMEDLENMEEFEGMEEFENMEDLENMEELEELQNIE